MLILARQRNQQIVCIVPPSDTPTVITHTTVDIRGDKVRHGFDAPKEVVIHRSEVMETIAREQVAKDAIKPVTQIGSVTP